MIKNRYSIGDEVLIIPSYRDDVCAYVDIIDEIVVDKSGITYSTSKFCTKYREDELILVKECTPKMIYDIVFKHINDNKEKKQDE